MARIALINCPPNDNREFIRDAVKYDEKLPLGLCYIAAYLERNGHNAFLIDAYAEGIDSNGIADRIKRLNPDFAGATMLHPNSQEVGLVMSKIKEVTPNVTTVVGGVQPTLEPESVLKSNQGIDLAVIGEGEITMKEIMDNFDARKDCRKVQGVAYRKAGEVRRSAARERISNLDILPFPALDKIPLEKYWGEKKVMCMVTSRGCPFHCIFCASSVLWGHSITYRSIENVMAEIRHWRDAYGCDFFYFNDMTFTIDRGRIDELCRRLTSEGLDIEWKCLTRLDNLDEALIARMADAGCREMAVGIESGNQDMQRMIRKHLDLKRVKCMIRTLSLNNINVLGLAIIGFPRETPEQILDTLNYLISLKEEGMKEFDLFQATPYPGTELYRMCNGANPQSHIIEDGNCCKEPVMKKQMRRHSFMPCSSPNEFFSSEELRGIIHLTYERFKSGKPLSIDDLNLGCEKWKNLHMSVS